MPRYTSCIILLLLLPFTGWCQKYLCRNYNAESGLPGSSVYYIHQDQRGFLWFCTDYGLSRFDGKNFHNILNVNNPYTHGSVMSMSENESGKRFVSTLQGCYEVTDSFSLKSKIYDGWILYTTPVKNKFWIIAKEGSQVLIESDGHNAKRHEIKNDTGGNVIFYKIVTVKGGEVLVTTSNGLYKIENGGPKPFMRDIVHEAVADVQKASDGSYWIALRNRIIQVKDNQITHQYPIKDGIVGNILCDHNDNVWVCIFREAICLIRQNKMEDISRYLDINKALVSDLAEDTEGNIWIATQENGVYEILSTDVFECTKPGEPSAIYCAKILMQDDSTQLISSVGKLFSCTKGVIKPIRVNLLKAGDHTYFVGRFRDALYIGTPNNLIKKSLAAPFREEFVKIGRPTGAVSMYIDSGKTLIVGGFRYFSRLVGNELIVDSADSQLPATRCTAFCRDSKGRLWIGTRLGLCCFQNGKCSTLIDSTQRGLRYICAIVEDKRHRIWAATHLGLVCFDGNGYKVYTKDNGLASNLLNDLAEENDRLWVATAFGLNFVNINTLEIKSYNTGINKNEVKSLCFDGHHSLFVGTSQKLISVDVDKIAPVDAPPKVYITSLKTTSMHLADPKSITLAYRDNKVTLDFIGLCLKTPEDIEYRYKVQNLDNDWHITGNTSIELASLPPGENIFVLNARKNKGPWSRDVLLPISVETPLWRSLWFIVIASFAALLFIYVIARNITLKKENKKHEQLLLFNKVTYLKQQALSALINPHFIFNCMNSIQHFLNNHDNDKANNYLADFAQLIRLTLENAQDSFINLDKELSRLRLYLSLEQLRFGDELSYEMEVDKDLDTRSINIPNMIIQPFIENAIWHGIMPNHGKGNINIKLSKLPNEEICVQLSDNGVGINYNKKQNSDHHTQPLGIKLISERLQLLSKLSGSRHELRVRELTGSDGAITGTMVEIILPVDAGEGNLYEPELQT